MIKKLAIAALLLVTACTVALERQQLADITFTGKAPIALDLAQISVTSRYRDNPAAPHVEIEFPKSIQSTAAQWPSQRLALQGSEGVFTLTIIEASVVEMALPRTTGIAGVVTTDQSERYDLHLVVEISGEHPALARQATARVEINRSITVAENISIEERERIWHSLTRKAMDDLDLQLTDRVNQDFAIFLR